MARGGAGSRRSGSKATGGDAQAKAPQAGGVRSMTGFGRAALDDGDLSARVEIRSVNHRHLQVKTRLPGELGHLEQPVEALVRKALDRGAVSLTVTVTRAPAAGVGAVDLDVARGYHAALTKLSRELGLGAVDLATLVALPGVLGTSDEGAERGREEKLVLRGVRAALDELLAMRAVEGQSLERDLRKNAAAVGKLVARIAKRMPAVVREHHRALTQRVNELLGDRAAAGELPASLSGGKAGAGKVLETDLPRELALLADRTDVSEELTRLGSHLAQLDEMIAGGGGRRLEFLVQELFREANTIGAKCNDATVAHAVVDLKTHIERLREQVQNVE